MLHFKEWLILLEGADYIDDKEYRKRLKAIGWTWEQNGSHWMGLSPDGLGKVTFSENNWYRNWNVIAQDLRQRAISPTQGYKDLDFVWKTPFEIPENFDITTQTILKPENSPGKEELVAKLMHNPENLTNKQIRVGDRWKHVNLATHSPNGRELEVMFDDDSIMTFNMMKTITVR